MNYDFIFLCGGNGLPHICEGVRMKWNYMHFTVYTVQHAFHSNRDEETLRGRGLRLQAGGRSSPLQPHKLFYDDTEFPLIRAFPVPRLPRVTVEF